MLAPGFFSEAPRHKAPVEVGLVTLRYPTELSFVRLPESGAHSSSRYEPSDGCEVSHTEQSSLHPTLYPIEEPPPTVQLDGFAGSHVTSEGFTESETWLNVACVVHVVSLYAGTEKRDPGVPSSDPQSESE